jgi:hypothetical protein
MNQEEFEKELMTIKPMLVPPNGDLSLVSFEDKVVELKITGIPEDIYKIQGKIINSGDEIKKTIINQLKEKFPDLDISFI